MWRSGREGVALALLLREADLRLLRAEERGADPVDRGAAVAAEQDLRALRVRALEPGGVLLLHVGRAHQAHHVEVAHGVGELVALPVKDVLPQEVAALGFARGHLAAAHVKDAIDHACCVVDPEHDRLDRLERCEAGHGHAGGAGDDAGRHGDRPGDAGTAPALAWRRSPGSWLTWRK